MMTLPKRALTVSAISIEALMQAGIKGIILDLDNTVVSEDDRYVSPQAETWIQTAQQHQIQFFMLSNGKRRYRVDYWSRQLAIPAISPARKPFPQSFRKALRQMQLQPTEAVVIGDSLHTDVIGAKLAGCPCIQVASLPHPPRWWERLVGRWVQFPYPSPQDLWPFTGTYPLD